MTESLHKTSMRRRRLRLWVPGFIRNDFWRKFIALCFALLIYFMVSNKIGTETSIDSVPVFINVPVKLINMDRQTHKVTVVVLGSKRQLNKLTTSDIKISATVIESKFRPGTPYSLKLTADDISKPFGVKIVNIHPAEIILNLEKRMSKMVAVKADFDAKKMAEDYIVGKVTIFPPEVRISGAGSLIQNIESVETVMVPLENQTESFEYSALIQKNRNYQLSIDRVTVNFDISKYLESKVFKAIPIKILKPSGSGDSINVELLSTPHVDVTINGPYSKLNTLEPEMIKSYIDISSLEVPGKYTVTVACWINLEGVRITSIFPKQVTIKLSHGKK